VLLLWAGSMFWLLRYEAFPEWFTGRVCGYRDLLPRGPLFLDSWMKLSIEGTPAGYSHTTIDTTGDSGNRRYTVKNLMVMSIKMMGVGRRLRISMNAELNESYQLQSFSLDTAARPYVMRIRARRREADWFEVTISSVAGEEISRVRIPDDLVLYSAAMDIAIRKCKPGDELLVKTFDPLTMSAGDVRIVAEGYETIMYNGEPIRTLRLTMNYHGMEIQTWIDDEGQTIREKTPYGWTLEKTTANDALNTINTAPVTADVLAGSMVPVDHPIRQPREAIRLRVAFYGSDTLPDISSPTFQEAIIERGTNSVVLERHRGGYTHDPNIERWLKPESFIQSNDPEIRQQAAQLIRNANDPIDIARQINRWVFTHVRKEPAISLPSALDVLRQRQGDCNEHTYLFVALARAAGIPAKPLTGLLYYKDGFYYHAWVAVYTGEEWVELDPALGQPVADATHIPLTEGGFDQQLQLLGVIGRIKANIIDVETRHD